MRWLISFYTGAKNGLYANSGNARGANDHIFTRIDLGDRNVDKFFGSRLGHEFGAVPLLEVLDCGETNLLGMTTIESHVNYVFVGRSRHSFNRIAKGRD